MRAIVLSMMTLAMAIAGCGGPEDAARAQQPSTAGAEQEQCPCPGMARGGEGMTEMCPGTRGGGMGMAMRCPMCAPLPAGASMRSEPIEAGVALTFTTPNDDDVEALRARVRAMAEAHARHHAPDPGERAGAGTRGMMRMPPSTARAADIERGARLELRAVDEQDVTALRAHVEQMRGCPMMAGQPRDEEPAG